MGGCAARCHGDRQGARRRFPDRRVPRDRACRGRHGAGHPRLDLWRQSAGGGGRQRRPRRDAGTRLFRTRRRDGEAAARAPRGAGSVLSKALCRAARLRSPARHPLHRAGRRFCRQAAPERPVVPDRRRKRAAHSAAADRRRARDRGGARRHAQGGGGVANMRSLIRETAAIRQQGEPTELPRHFLDLDQFDSTALRRILDLGIAYKNGRRERPLAGKTLAMIFEKPSTRTRVSFEVAMRHLGGDTIFLDAADTQLGRGETVGDTARVLSRYVDAIMIRTNESRKLEELAEHATVPVINGLTDASHPCQVMADVMTLQEKKGPLAGRIVSWSGDGNNVAASWVHAAVRFGFTLRLACPEELAPERRLIDW